MGHRRDEPDEGAMAKLGATELPHRLIASGRRSDALAGCPDSAAAQTAPGAGRLDRARRMGSAAALSLQPRAGNDAADQSGLENYRSALDSAARARWNHRDAANARTDREGQIAGLAPARNGIGHQMG